MISPERWISPFAAADGPPPDKTMRFLRWALRGAGQSLAGGAALSVVAGALEVLSALILGLVIDSAVGGDVKSLFSDNAVLFAGVALFFLVLRPAVLGLSGVMQSVVVAPAVYTLVLSRLHRHTLGQAVTFFDNDFAGRISQKQMQAARATTDLAVDTIQTAFFALSSLIGSVLLLSSIDGVSGILLAVWVIAYAGMIRFFMPQIRKRSRARAGRRAMVTGQVVDTITNIKTVKLFAHGQHEDRAAIDAMDQLRSATIDFGWVSASFRFWLMALAGMLPVLLVGMTLWLWTQGGATAGDIAISGSIGLRLAQMTGWVSFTLMGMYANFGEIEDAVQALSPPHALIDAPDATELSVTEGRVQFENVTFAYGREAGGVQGVSLEISPGERVGLVGASGAGKSTLISLLLRLYDAESGHILIDGQDVSKVTQDSLRRNIGTVTQETAMFNRSARDNISYGYPGATEAQVVLAAQRAEADDFIVGLEDFKGRKGYDAYLGERGVKLSGGQRQRIAIARTILKDAPILLLDEATSALDSEVEAAIQSSLETIMDGKTVIAIAHRLSTLSQMDRIVVLDAGRIVEEGTHSDLLNRNGLYARYWNRQSGGFINAAAE